MSEFSEDPGTEGMRFICLRPGCSYDVGVLDGEAAVDVGIAHEATAHFGEPRLGDAPFFEFAGRLIDHGLNDDGTPWALIWGDASDLPNWRYLLERFIKAPPETRFADPLTDAPWPPPDERPWSDPDANVAAELDIALAEARERGYVIWDDPPPDPDRAIDRARLMEWYDQYFTTETHDNADGSRTSFAIRRETMEDADLDPATRAYFADDEVRCGTWAVPAACAVAAAVIVYLSWRWTDR